MGRKGHSIFVLKWNWILTFLLLFVFIIKLKDELQIQISIFNKNWKINFCSFFSKNFFCTQALLWSVTSSKLPLKTDLLFFYFQFFKKWKIKQRILKFKFNFWISFFFLIVKLNFRIYIKNISKQNIYFGYISNQYPERSEQDLLDWERYCESFPSFRFFHTKTMHKIKQKKYVTFSPRKKTFWRNKYNTTGKASWHKRVFCQDDQIF